MAKFYSSKGKSIALNIQIIIFSMVKFVLID